MKEMAGEKIKNLNEDEFVEKVLAYNEDVAKQAEAAGIDTRAFVIGTKSSVDKYGISTGVAYANARLKEAVIEANSETIKGMIVGQRDRYGTNAPMRIPVLTSSGDDSEVILWGHTVKSGDSKIGLPIPSLVYDARNNRRRLQGSPQRESSIHREVRQHIDSRRSRTTGEDCKDSRGTWPRRQLASSL